MPDSGSCGSCSHPDGLWRVYNCLWAPLAEGTPEPQSCFWACSFLRLLAAPRILPDRVFPGPSSPSLGKILQPSPSLQRPHFHHCILKPTLHHGAWQGLQKGPWSGRYSQWWFVEGMSLFPPAWGSALPGWTEEGGETLPLYAWALG